MYDQLFLGRRWGEEPFHMPIDDCRRHFLLSGTTGVGKSTLLLSMWFQHANTGRGAVLIDPHGDLAEAALNCVPRHRIKKTIYLNPGGDPEFPVAFNPLYNVPKEQRPVRAAQLLNAFKSIWHDAWGARLNTILYHSLAALLDIGDATLLCIPRLLLDAEYRKRILDQVEDAKVRQWWEMTFPYYLSQGPDAMTPVLNRIDQFLASPHVRNVLAQPKATFDPRHAMDHGYLVVVNLSKGVLGPEHANLLGSLLIACFGSAAMSRADMPAAQRRDFAMIIDEFQNYASTEIKDFLAEVRKYNLSVVLSHQHFGQMHPDVRAAVIGNVGSYIVFRVGADDARVLESTFAEIPSERLTETSNHRARVRLLHSGNPTSVFELHTPKPPKQHGHGAYIQRYSREHFGRPRAGVEERIDRFLGSSRFKKPKMKW